MAFSGLDMPTAARTAPTDRSRATVQLLAVLLLVFGTIAAKPDSARAQDPKGPIQAPKGMITEVKIEGNDSIATERILDKLKSRAGRELDDRTIEDDQNSLAKSGWFVLDDIQVATKADPARKGFILIFTVREMPILHEVEFRGMKAVKRKDIESNTGLKVGARADNVKNMLAVGSIERLYREKGYDYAQVRLLEGGKPNSTKAIFEIFEGPKCVIRSTKFEGNKFVPDATLDTKISCKPKLLGVLPSKFNRDELEADAKKLREYYDGLGYFEVKVNAVTRPGPEPGQIDITFVVWEGVQYRVRSILFEGNEKIATETLMDGMKLQKGLAYSERLREVDEKSLKTKYGKIGCIYAQVVKQPPVYLDEPGLVDLVYRIDEGASYRLARIIVKGNSRTQDRVIRREFNQGGVVPEEPLDSERIELVKKRLTNLRYFASDPAQGKPIDIQPANRRAASQPFATGTLPAAVQNAAINARLQNPGPDADPPRSGTRVARRQDAPPAAGAGPASVTPLEEPPSGFSLPPIEVPALPNAPGQPPTANGPPFVPAGPPGTSTPPAGNREPPGTFPSVPGMNMTDVGPGRNEPFANRDYADLVTSLDETTTGRLMMGVGATSYGGIFGNLIVHESNFDYKALPKSWNELVSGNSFRGAGQDLRIELSPGTQVNRAQISFRNPYVFDLPVGFGSSLYTFRRFFSDYTEDRTGARLSLGSQFGLKTYADVAVRAENVNFHGFSYPAPAPFLAAAGRTALFSLRPSLRFDNRNDPFATTAGQYLEFAFEQGWGTFTFPKFTAEGRQYFTLGSRPDGTGKRFVTLRSFFGITGRDTPVYERFFAGDFRSMRGFSYRGVGPRELGVNVGGVMELLGSVEYQFPWLANDKLQQVVFCDFGTVESNYTITQFRAAIGTGVRIYLPQQMFGPLPLAFDLAFPVLKGPEDHTRIFTFFIGAFW
jgi:outer membrane protein insertion porin family